MNVNNPQMVLNAARLELIFSDWMALSINHCFTALILNYTAFNHLKLTFPALAQFQTFLQQKTIVLHPSG